MAIRDTGTEALIKDTAKQIFFAEGKFNATTQEIADAAGVARTVIHYYFRSKDSLLKEVFKEAMLDTDAKMNAVLIAKLPFKKKVSTFIDMFTAELTRYPYRELFLINEINTHGFTFLPEKPSGEGFDQFLKEIQMAVDEGLIKKILPLNFFINLISLISHPLLTRPLIEQSLAISNITFEKLMNDRKKMILNLYFQ